MRRAAVRDAARAIRRTSHDVADRKQETMLGIIRDLEPLKVELAESNVRLDEDDVSLGQGVKRYDRETGLKVGDSLVLVPLRGGDWVAQEVVSEREPSVPKITGSRDGNAALKDLLDALDKLGLVKDETTG